MDTAPFKRLFLALSLHMPAILLLTSFFEKAWTWISQLDTWLFLKINTEWTNSFLDSIYPWYREANAWVPLYLFLVVFSIQNFGKRALVWIGFIILTLILTDQISSHILKPFFERPRPCRDEVLMSEARLILNNCSGGYSFPSSHATNHFGFSMFVFLTLLPVAKKWRYLFFVWAATICYGQVYVGVHYPVDVLCGSLLGCLIGAGMGWMYNQKMKPLAP